MMNDDEVATEPAESAAIILAQPLTVTGADRVYSSPAVAQRDSLLRIFSGQVLALCGLIIGILCDSHPVTNGNLPCCLNMQ